MKEFNDVIIIGVDHGYGNIKTANHCFRTGMNVFIVCLQTMKKSKKNCLPQ